MVCPDETRLIAPNRTRVRSYAPAGWLASLGYLPAHGTLPNISPQPHGVRSTDSFISGSLQTGPGFVLFGNSAPGAKPTRSFGSCEGFPVGGFGATVPACSGLEPLAEPLVERVQFESVDLPGRLWDPDPTRCRPLCAIRSLREEHCVGQEN